MAWAARGPWVAWSDRVCIHSTEHNRHDRLQIQQSRSSPCFKRFTVTTVLIPYLFQPFKRERITGFHWPERGEGVQNFADTADLKEVSAIENNWINHSVYLLLKLQIIPFSCAQSHRQTLELLVAWGQKECL